MGVTIEIRAGRFIATPFAETLNPGRSSIWQFGLYERKSSKDWRGLNRLDLGLAQGVELGVFVISLKNKQADTWINLQYRPLKETHLIPALAVGIWDVTRRGSWFLHQSAGPSPFVSLGKSVILGDRYAKAGVSYGFNRLNGFFAGGEIRFLKRTGILGEYIPKNSRLSKAGAMDIGLYQWLGKNWRLRVSSMGGNPMADIFFTYVIGDQRAG